MDTNTRTALIGLAGTALGYILNFLSTLWISHATKQRTETENKRLDRWKKEDIRRDRLEELYSLIDAFIKAMGGTFILSLVYMNGKMSAEDFNKKCTLNRESVPFRFDRIEMLIAMYFSSLEDEWKQVMRVRDRANSLRPIIGSGLTAEHQTRSRLQEFEQEMELFNTLGENFKVRLTDLSKSMQINAPAS